MFFLSFRRPVRRFILAGKSELLGLAAIREHGPNLPRAGARRLENDMASIRRPARPLVSSSIARQFHERPAHDIHYIKIEISRRPPPRKREQLPVRRPRRIDDI